LIEDLFYKDHGHRVKATSIDWKPLKSIMDSDKRNITLNFKKSIGKFRPFTSDITETDATYFNDLNLRIQKKNIENL
jgi:hypothetical protein